jgi:hypothetical protein
MLVSSTSAAVAPLGRTVLFCLPVLKNRDANKSCNILYTYS